MRCQPCCAALTRYQRPNCIYNARPIVAPADSALRSRSETTCLHIIGAFLRLILGQSRAGQPYSSFRTQEAIITALVSLHGERLGITERTLQAKFAAAKRALAK